MSKFCKTHVVERTTYELLKRRDELNAKKELGPGLARELANILEELNLRN